MNEISIWVTQNKTWFFSGLGVFLLSGILLIIRQLFFKTKSNSSITQSQTVNEALISNQAGRDINNNQIVLYSIEEISKKLLCSAFGEMPTITKEYIQDNQKSYFDSLSDRLKAIHEQSKEIKNVIDSPDFQYISKQATISASRQSSKELHNNLASLLIQRINHDQTDLKRIVLDEAITIVDKLTRDQLQILTANFILTRARLDGLSTIDQFKKFLDDNILPFLSFKNTRAEFEHLVYTGCANISIMVTDISNLFKQSYPNIFNESDNVLDILRGNQTMEKLQKICKDSQLMRLELTTVGIVIASTHLEQITKSTANIDIWIN